VTKIWWKTCAYDQRYSSDSATYPEAKLKDEDIVKHQFYRLAKLFKEHFMHF